MATGVSHGLDFKVKIGTDVSDKATLPGRRMEHHARDTTRVFFPISKAKHELKIDYFTQKHESLVSAARLLRRREVCAWCEMLDYALRNLLWRLDAREAHDTKFRADFPS